MVQFHLFRNYHLKIPLFSHALRLDEGCNKVAKCSLTSVNHTGEVKTSSHSESAHVRHSLTMISQLCVLTVLAHTRREERDKQGKIINMVLVHLLITSWLLQYVAWTM